MARGTAGEPEAGVEWVERVEQPSGRPEQFAREQQVWTEWVRMGRV